MRIRKRDVIAKKKNIKKAAATGAKRQKMMTSGLTSFSIDSSEAHRRTGAKALAAGRDSFKGFAKETGISFKQLDPEAAARTYLDNAFANPAVRNFTRPKIKSAESAFQTVDAQAVPLTGTTVVKFRQAFNKIPVYGSLVTVELGKENECLSINSALGEPADVDHVAKVAPADALKVAAKSSGQDLKDLKQTPRLYYYYDQNTDKWSLAYIVEDVTQSPKTIAQRKETALTKDYVVDAHSGKLLAALPRSASMALVEEVVVDALKEKRTIFVDFVSKKKQRLHDSRLNVTTYGFNFKDPAAQEKLLPGKLYEKPPEPWPLEAIGAHANGSSVATFLRSVLKRNNIDNKGGEMVSTVNCCDGAEANPDVPNEWKNAYWNGKQMVYGQVKYPDGSFFSVASMLDVVAHEMFHGVTDATSRLEYQTQAGALNESYSDIFGIIIANFSKPLDKWTWELGVGFEGPGAALRSFKDPTKYNQPKFMKNFQKATRPYDDENDYGWVHENSGIHNYAAYRIMTAKDGKKYIFSPTDLAGMFYVALTVYLSRTSEFIHSRRAVLQATRSLFRNESEASLARRVKAVEAGFSAAGIK